MMYMLSNDLQKKVDRLWQDFWPANTLKPLSVLEFLIYLMRLKMHDAEKQSPISHVPDLSRLGDTAPELYWQQLCQLDEATLYQVYILPGGTLERIVKIVADDPVFSRNEDDSDILVPTSTLLFNSIQLLQDIDLGDPQQGGPLFSYLVSKISDAQDADRAPTSSELASLLIHLVNPGPGEKIVDLCSGSASLIVESHREIERKNRKYASFRNLHQVSSSSPFVSIDTNRLIARIGIMNMILNGVSNFHYKVENVLGADSLTCISEASAVVGHIPRNSSVELLRLDPSIIQTIGTSSKSAAILHAILKAMKPGSRCALIVPHAILHGNDDHQLNTRKALTEVKNLEAVISLPPEASADNNMKQSAILLFRNSEREQTEQVWFFQADNTSVVDSGNPYQQILYQWNNISTGVDAGDSPVSMMVSISQIREANYDLRFDRYVPVPEVQEEQSEYFSPFEENGESSRRSRSKALFVGIFLAAALSIGGYFYFSQEREIRMASPAAIMPAPDSVSRPGEQVTQATSGQADLKQENPENTKVPQRVEAGDSESVKEDNEEPEQAGDDQYIGHYKILSKAYFHNGPDESTRRNAYVVHWNNAYATLKALKEQDGFVYVEFKNDLGQVSKGWLLKKDLQRIEDPQ